MSAVKRYYEELYEMFIESAIRECPEEMAWRWDGDRQAMEYDLYTEFMDNDWEDVHESLYIAYGECLVNDICTGKRTALQAAILWMEYRKPSLKHARYYEWDTVPHYLRCESPEW